MEKMNFVFMPQTISTTKKILDESKKNVTSDTSELRLANLINLVNLSLISKEDVLNDSIYQLYREFLLKDEDGRQKSLVK